MADLVCRPTVTRQPGGGMLKNVFDQPGWSDQVGPLWFLQPRWGVGPPWRPAWGRYFAGQIGVTLQAHSRKGGYPVAGTFIPKLLWNDLSYSQKEEVTLSWVSKLRHSAGSNGRPPDASDPEWVLLVPAVHEFLTLGAYSDGATRRTATITLFADSGAWKAFLNDRDNGCSLCSSGPTIADSLSALEVMLESERPPWRFSGASEGTSRPRGKKSS